MCRKVCPKHIKYDVIGRTSMSNKVSLERHVFIRKIQNNISVMVIPISMWYNKRKKIRVTIQNHIPRTVSMRLSFCICGHTAI